MRTVSFFVHGAVGESWEERGSVADLLASIPYLLSAQIVPPFGVVNELLAKGRSSAGMSGGCQWEPFQITQSEWHELAQSLLADKGCSVVQAPDWASTLDDWKAWIMVFKHGYPEEFIALERECRALERARQRAVDDGNESLALELHLRVIAAGTKLGEFVMTHRRKTSE